MCIYHIDSFPISHLHVNSSARSLMIPEYQNCSTDFNSFDCHIKCLFYSSCFNNYI
mgnify:CR=1 FL=1